MGDGVTKDAAGWLWLQLQLQLQVVECQGVSGKANLQPVPVHAYVGQIV